MNKKIIEILKEKAKKKRLDISFNEYELKELDNIRKAIKQRKLVVTFRGGLNWDIAYIKNNELEHLSYWFKRLLQPYRVNRNSHYICVSCYGTSRPLELILSIGYSVGLKFNEIPQNQKVWY